MIALGRNVEGARARQEEKGTGRGRGAGKGRGTTRVGRNETGDVTTAEGREIRGTRKGWKRWGRSRDGASSGEGDRERAELRQRAEG